MFWAFGGSNGRNVIGMDDGIWILKESDDRCWMKKMDSVLERSTYVQIQDTKSTH